MVTMEWGNSALNALGQAAVGLKADVAILFAKVGDPPTESFSVARDPWCRALDALARNPVNNDRIYKATMLFNSNPCMPYALRIAR
jgi:hypothetical protein